MIFTNTANTVEIRLNTIEKVRSFVSMMSTEDGEFVLSEGGLLVDAKSIMGIFAMNLTKNLKLSFSNTTKPEAELMNDLKPFRV